MANVYILYLIFFSMEDRGNVLLGRVRFFQIGKVRFQNWEGSGSLWDPLRNTEVVKEGKKTLAPSLHIPSRRPWESNSRPPERKADTLPLSHCVGYVFLISICYTYVYMSVFASINVANVTSVGIKFYLHYLVLLAAKVEWVE